jgi:lipoic acid synthetase
LEDSGAGHFAQTIQEILRRRPTLLVEALTGDFQGNVQAANVVAASGLHVFAHNLETVEELTPWVRDRRASYRQSLGILRAVKDRHPHLLTKSSLMLGLGETDEQVAQTLKGRDQTNK